MKTVVLVVHIAAASVVLGASLGWGRLLRQAAEAGQAAARVAIADVARRMVLVRITSMMTLFTGVALIFISGGFAVVPKNYHIALTLMLAGVGWVFLGVVPKVKGLAKLAAAPEFDREKFAGSVGKVGMATGIVHALWLSLLVLMFVRV
jgi:hypothetical protein